MTDYLSFLEAKSQTKNDYGFAPTFLPDLLFDFQKSLVEWATVKGRAAIFADCGLGKTFCQLAWAENVARHTGGRILILTPLAVSFQTVLEGEKIGVEVTHRREGIHPTDRIVVTNYERLHYFNCADFDGVVCDESSILKNFSGQTKADITRFMAKRPYRLLCTATAAPNDYVELGTSSEALGELSYLDMLKMFFKSTDNAYTPGGHGVTGIRRFNYDPFGGKYRFIGHAERDFWRWVCSWARAMRTPSDLGFSDEGFKLPPLIVNEHIVNSRSASPDMLFPMLAVSLDEQREELRRTIPERCEMAAALVVAHDGATVSWCHLNDEGKMLRHLIPGSVEISGSDSDDRKESVFADFAKGNIQHIITKPKIAGFGLNWQHCARHTFFPSHSYEQYYQAVRRSWRFGQKNPVTVDLIITESQEYILKNLQRKSDAASQMFAQLVALMRNELKIRKVEQNETATEVPSWL